MRVFKLAFSLDFVVDISFRSRTNRIPAARFASRQKEFPLGLTLHLATIYLIEQKSQPRAKKAGRSKPGCPSIDRDFHASLSFSIHLIPEPSFASPPPARLHSNISIFVPSAGPSTFLCPGRKDMFLQRLRADTGKRLESVRFGSALLCSESTLEKSPKNAVSPLLCRFLFLHSFLFA